MKKKGSSSLGESTSTESNNNYLSLKKNLKFFEDNDKNEEKDVNDNNNIFNKEEICIDNNDDY